MTTSFAAKPCLSSRKSSEPPPSSSSSSKTCWTTPLMDGAGVPGGLVLLEKSTFFQQEFRILSSGNEVSSKQEIRIFPLKTDAVSQNNTIAGSSKAFLILALSLTASSACFQSSPAKIIIFSTKFIVFDTKFLIFDTKFLIFRTSEIVVSRLHEVHPFIPVYKIDHFKSEFHRFKCRILRCKEEA